jgi:toxin ParE1/3/4
MKGVVRRRAGAQRDLIAIYRRYAREAGLRIADRFLAAAEKTFRHLAGMPGMGTRYEHDHPALAELRVSPLSPRFKVYLVFYRPVAEGIEIVRVLHGARDIHGILAEEFGIEADVGDDEDGE